MKEKILNLLKSNLLFSVVLNTLIILFCIAVTSFSYDSIDDFYNSLYICQRHFYFSNSINYILSTIIGTVQYVFTNINCFVFAQVLLSWITFISITFVFADKFNKKKALTITLLINVLFSLNHYANINSSKTAALLLAGGFLLVLNAIHNKRYNLPCWIGVAEIAFGSFFDYKYFFVALGFACAFFMGDMIAKKKYKYPLRKFFWYFRPFLLMFILVTVTVVCLNNFSYSVNNATDIASDYHQYSDLMDKTESLPYPNYSDYKEQFSEIGIDSENDYDLLKNGYYDNQNALNNTALELVNDLQQEENSNTILYATVNAFANIGLHFTNFNCFALVIISLVAIVVLFIVFQKRRFAFFPVFYLITGLISSIILKSLYPYSEHLVYGIWLMMVVYILYSFDFEQLRPKKAESLPKYRKTYRIISFSLVLCLSIVYGIIFHANSNIPDSKHIPQSLLTEIDRHPEKYYVLDPDTANNFMKYTENYLHPMWGFRSEFLNNVDGFSYFHNKNTLRRRNMSENIYEAVLSNNNIYVIDKNITFRKEMYFTENYAKDNETVVYKQVNELDGYKIYEVQTQK